MPRLLAALYGSAAMAFVGLVAGTSGAMACGTPQQEAMFDVAGLKSELMVTTLSCNADAQYNAFITRYQSILQADDAALQNYFVHTYGRAGQAAHDAYITTIANKMSEIAVAEGNNFCRNHLAIFSEALALDQKNDLALFAASRGYVEPIAPESCGETVAVDARELTAER
ncbi:MAG TPA: hypothetical protein VMA86_12545 [Acetobacteraceae bacterium]|nr:hypothetical protein [Acetobacteraceae bacterium]